MAGAQAGEFPGSIVLVIDETKGGDAIVAPPGAITSLQSLNDPEARLVLTPNSPSEFLARVVIAHFNLPNLPAQWSIPADGAADVYKKFRAASAAEKGLCALVSLSKALQKQSADPSIASARVTSSMCSWRSASFCAIIRTSCVPSSRRIAARPTFSHNRPTAWSKR
jgi:hypothetical protein